MGQAEDGGMAAALGADGNKIEDIVREIGFKNISIANYNSPSQIVISGAKEEIKKAAPFFKEAGIRYLILNVSGAFHSVYMKDAEREFSAFVKKVEFSELEIPVVSNVTAKPHLQKNIKKLLISQITSPVRWTESIQYLMEQGDMKFEEIGPGSVLTGLIAKIRKESSFKLSPPVGTKQEKFKRSGAAKKERE